eukprot:UN14901
MRILYSQTNLVHKHTCNNKIIVNEIVNDTITPITIHQLVLILHQPIYKGIIMRIKIILLNIIKIIMLIEIFRLNIIIQIRIYRRIRTFTIQINNPHQINLRILTFTNQINNINR